ncbi:ParB/RepB/Spo0J family partition protein [Pseudonocardia acaciae]|uniref:ParB/RepB/Spo0J family partition protein n=1 Tax=Pseudonocardia acaciae TaxID=551276 RepID=UPI00048CCFC5|nr:ParB/RepB/Spo0J family partition protein [Pseudonocardia acaciae]
MNTRKGGLGRGLAALIPTGPEDGAPGAAAQPIRVATAPRRAPADGTADGEAEQITGMVAGASYRELATASIGPNPQQPRRQFDEEALAELSHSIKEFGLLQPIVVREVGPDRYQLIMGERRWRAAQEAGLDTLPAIVRQTEDDALLRDALLENIHRVQLNPLEEAAAYEQLLAEFGVTHDQLADRLGRSRPVVTNMIRLLRLPVAVQRRVAAGVLSAGHARALLGLDDAGRQEELAARVVAEGMSVRATEEAVTLAKREPEHNRSTAKKRTERPPELDRVAGRLSDSFDTRVKVEMGQRKGKIVVEFGSLDDLERIVTLMSPDD